MHQAGIQTGSITNGSRRSALHLAAACEESPLSVTASPACQHLQNSFESRTFVDVDCLVQVCLEWVEAVSQLCARLRPPCNNPQMLPALLAERHSTLQGRVYHAGAAHQKASTGTAHTCVPVKPAGSCVAAQTQSVCRWLTLTVRLCQSSAATRSSAMRV